MQAIMETIFDVLYLSTVIGLGIIMIRQNRGNKLFFLFGIMSVVLGVGDSFHLIPRAYALSTDGLANHVTALGIGKLITSITMTVFYIILYEIWRIRYNIQDRKSLSTTMYALAALRILLSLLPQNEWLSPTPSLTFGIIRNLPFALMGLIIIVIFYQEAKKHQDKSFQYMWLAITLSFAFYIPVVLFSEIYPIIGALMIPKTLAYVWTVWMGYQAMKVSRFEKNPIHKIKV